MKASQLGAAVRYLFSGWDHVDCFKVDNPFAGGDFVVKLRVSELRLQAHIGHERELMSKLFVETEVKALARVIASRQRAMGLRRYGRRK